MAWCEQLLNPSNSLAEALWGIMFWAFKVAGLFLQHPACCKGSKHRLGALCPQGRAVAGKRMVGPWEGTWVTDGLQSSSVHPPIAQAPACSVAVSHPLGAGGPWACPWEAAPPLCAAGRAVGLLCHPPRLWGRACPGSLQSISHLQALLAEVMVYWNMVMGLV